MNIKNERRLLHDFKGDIITVSKLFRVVENFNSFRSRAKWQ